MSKELSRLLTLVFTCLQYKSFENTVGKGKIVRNHQFLFPKSVFHSYREFSAIFTKSKIVICKLFQPGRVFNWSFGKGFSPFPTMFSTCPKTNFNFSVTFILSSTNAFNLDQSKNLLFGKELREINAKEKNGLIFMTIT